MFRLILPLLFSATALAQTPAPAEPSPESAPEAATAAAPPEPPLYPDRESRDMHLLAAVVPEDQKIWISQDGEPVLALYQAALSPKAVGAVLIVEDQDLHARWPGRLNALRLSLPEQGWSSLWVGLPPPAVAPAPAREVPPLPAAQTPTDADDAEPPADAGARPETEEVFDDSTGEVAPVAALQAERPADEPGAAPTRPAAERADERLVKALELLRDKGQFNLVLLAEGAGAVRAARLMAALKYDGFRALVLLDARHRAGDEPGDVLKMLEMMDVPVLDLTSGQHPDDASELRLRRQQAARAGLALYQPFALPAQEPGHARLVKRVRGFLDKHAQGVEVEAAVGKK